MSDDRCRVKERKKTHTKGGRLGYHTVLRISRGGFYNISSLSKRDKIHLSCLYGYCNIHPPSSWVGGGPRAQTASPTPPSLPPPYPTAKMTAALVPAARQLSVLAPAFGLHTALISRVTLRVPPLGDLYLEDAIGAAAALWLAPRCVPPLAALSSPASEPSLPRLSRRRLAFLLAALGARYLLSGCIKQGAGWLLAAATPRLAAPRAWALATLAGHLAWVGMAVRLLGDELGFFAPRSAWLRLDWSASWLRWVLCGAAACVPAFELASSLAPSPELGLGALASAAPTITAQITSLDDGLAFALSVFTACASGPFLEEVLYRGFLLRALRQHMPLGLAAPASAALFALHHGTGPPTLPLAALGLVFSATFVGSGNLAVSILTHSLWNLRVVALSRLR